MEEAEHPAAPAWGWRIALALLGRLPNVAMSRAFGRVADAPIPRRARRLVLGAFARLARVDASEAEAPFEAYATLNEYFVRRLRPGARSWPSDPDALASPVDGIVGEVGRIADGSLLQAKGHRYGADELLCDAAEARRYGDGSYVTIYLSPRHYHRIHTPAPGHVRAAVHVPGRLLPVNAPAITYVPRLFVTNERVVCSIEARRGRLALAAIGAYNVGRISTAFDPAWRPPPSPGRRPAAPTPALERRVYDPPIAIGVGAEIMAFHLGSTVVLLIEPGSWRLRPDLRPGMQVRVGERLDVP